MVKFFYSIPDCLLSTIRDCGVKCKMKKKLIVYLDDKNLIRQSSEQVRQLVGGKAWNLIRLKNWGLNVPQAFVITTEAQGKITGEVKRLILENLTNLDTKKLAVRSSATVEDTELASFAGLFESYLGVSKKELVTAIEKCFSSITNERVRIYCGYKKISLANIKMAVVIQEMIFAEKGGVIFTEDIFRQNKDILVIEAAKGLGEKVVSGLVNPERLMVSKETKTVVERQAIDGPVLTEKEIKALVEIAAKIEALYQSAQDIEWAIMDNEIFILQSRPITG